MYLQKLTQVFNCLHSSNRISSSFLHLPPNKYTKLQFSTSTIDRTLLHFRTVHLFSSTYILARFLNFFSYPSNHKLIFHRLHNFTMINAILVFNNYGKPRLSKFYQYYVSKTHFLQLELGCNKKEKIHFRQMRSSNRLLLKPFNLL